MRKVLLTLIISHGITDLFLPFEVWQPIYLCSLFMIILPLKYINGITLLLSTIHFNNDIDFIEIYQTFLILMIFIYYGRYKISQNIIIGYMALIHTPIHLYHNIVSFSALGIYIIFSIIIYNFNYIHNLINTIITSISSEPNTIEHKLLLSIINAHIIVNSNFIKNVSIV
jgi:hypothetical protein